VVSVAATAAATALLLVAVGLMRARAADGPPGSPEQ
jgi:hypothetical protein